MNEIKLDKLLNWSQRIYYRYLTHIGATGDFEQLWSEYCNGIIQQFEVSGDHFKCNFATYFISVFEQIDRINVDYYDRNAGKKPIEVVKSNGGRYWL